MSSSPGHEREHLEGACLHALAALPRDEGAGVEAHLQTCAECRREVEALRPVVDRFVDWPTDVLRPSPAVWERLSARIAAEAGQEALPLQPPQAPDREWDEVAPGISCKVLATDGDRGRVTMLVRLAPGAAYPPHTHGGLEELHMLEGELMVDERRLAAGDYLRSEPGTSDRRVWSEHGCTGVLITSSRDILR